MATVVLPKGSLMSFNGNAITEHNRGEVSVEITRIENSDRMHDGTLRKVVIADKLKWSTSWNDLPDVDAKAVDGKWAGKSLEAFYKANPGVFVLNIKESGVATNYNAVITDFSKTVKKRGDGVELWDIDITIEEV
jgi:hypothetical protein